VRRWTDVRTHSSKSVDAGRRGEEHSNSHSSTLTLGDRRQLRGTALVLWLSAGVLLDGAPPPAVRASALRTRRVIMFANRSAWSVWARVAWLLEAWEGGGAGKHLERGNRPPLVPRIFNCAGGAPRVACLARICGVTWVDGTGLWSETEIYRVLWWKGSRETEISRNYLGTVPVGQSKHRW